MGNTVSNNLSLAISNVLKLPNITQDLINAIDNEEVLEVVSKTKEIINVSKDIFTSIDDFADALKDLPPSSLGGGTDFANEVKSFAQKLPGRLLDYLVVTQLERVTGLAEAMEFLGVISREQKNSTSSNQGDSIQYTERKVAYNNFFPSLTKPTKRIKELYGWGESNFGDLVQDRKDMLVVLEKLLVNIGAPAILDNAPGDHVLDIQGIEIDVDKASSPRGLNVVLGSSLSLDPIISYDQDGIEIEIGMDIPFPEGLSLLSQPDGKVTLSPVDPSTNIQGTVFFDYKNKPSNGQDAIVLLGQTQGSRLETKEIGLRLENKLDWQPLKESAEGEMKFTGYAESLKLIISLGEGDSFLTSNLPAGGFEVDFNLLLGYSSKRGLFFEGSAALEIVFPFHLKLGPVELQQLILRIEIGNPLGIGMGTNVKFNLGPFVAIVENIGVNSVIKFPDEGRGNLGPVDFGIEFKPPTGIGLALDAGAVRGGGYISFDPDKGEYAGVAELTVIELVSVKAIAIITTKNPDGSKGFSFLLLITAEFTPIQLGFGFTLNGVGGIIGINRGINSSNIAQGVRENAIDHVMFPENPVANAPMIIASLNSYFPINQGQYAFGFMGILGWGTPSLITLEVGFMFTFPEPVSFIILGVLKMQLPDEKVPIVNLQVSFIGEINFTEKYIFFFASLYGSRIAQWTVSGEMYFSIDFGDNPNFVFSVGGFHPDYVPPPLKGGIGQLKRVTLNLLGGNNPRLTLSFYVAVTSNTVQFGAAADFMAKAWKIRVVGYLYFDALFQFNPFYFKVSIGAGLAVMWGSRELFGIHLSGSLEGPSPWRIQGKATFRILFVKVKVRVDKTFGERKETSLPPKPILPFIQEPLRDIRNWVASRPNSSQLQITTRKLDSEDLVAHPFSVIGVSQNRVPLKLDLDKVGSNEPEDYKKFKFNLLLGDDQNEEDSVVESGALKDFFAPAEYIELSNAQKLSRKSFEKFDAGVKAMGQDGFTTDNQKIDDEDVYGDYVEKTLEHELCEIHDLEEEAMVPDPPVIESRTNFGIFIQGNAVALSEQGRANRLKNIVLQDRVQVVAETYQIVNTESLAAIEKGGSVLTFSTETQALNLVDQMVKKQPKLRGAFQVVSSTELN